MSTEDCARLQEQEWQVIQSIYPEFLPSKRPKTGEPFVLQVDVRLPEPMPVLIFKEDSSSDTTSPVVVSHLPPLSLDLLLPPSYPLELPPTIRLLHSSHDWLPATLIEYLTNLLLDMWDNEGVLSFWIEHIQNGEDLLSSLRILHSSPKAIHISNTSPHILLPALAAYNVSVLESRFRNATHTCPICLNRLLGTHCIALSPCSHVACRSCLGAFWSSCILEGDVTRVGCPDPNCVKESRQASIDDVKSVASPEDVARWQWLLRKREIEQDPTTIHCPLIFCQKPVKRPPPAEDGREDHLRICECGFSFCMYCRRTWHGTQSPCSISLSTEFVTSYLQHPVGSPERLAIEQRYGRSNVLKMITRFQEEQSNRRWMEQETMACPGCHIRVQKNMGCNHMTCVKCREHFCYRCGAKIEPSNPYRHFNTPGQPCYSRLFDLHSQDEEHWEAMEGFGL